MNSISNHGPLAGDGRPDPDPHEARLAQRRVDHAVWPELREEALGDLVRAASLPDPLADHEDRFVALHLPRRGRRAGPRGTHLRHQPTPTSARAPRPTDPGSGCELDCPFQRCLDPLVDLSDAASSTPARARRSRSRINGSRASTSPARRPGDRGPGRSRVTAVSERHALDERRSLAGAGAPDRLHGAIDDRRVVAVDGEPGDPVARRPRRGARLGHCRGWGSRPRTGCSRGRR